MRFRAAVLVFPFLLAPPAIFSASTPASEDSPRKVIRAVRIAEPIRIDGLLTETVWQGRGYSDFIQREPVEGAPPTEQTEVYVAYDDHALYIAARMHDSRPDSVVGRLARRDQDSDSDLFTVGIDAAFDRRTAVYFRVNPAGAIEDGRISNDTEMDSGWDGVWEVAVAVDDGGWSAELRIPFSQLRFPHRDTYVWGIEFNRRIKRKNEEVYLVLHPRNDFVRVSRFSELHGIEGISPPARVELRPHVASTGKFLQKPPVDAFNAGRRDPFVFGRDYIANVGADIKLGLSGDVTLDATFNPDFAQVEVDPAVVNLTAYEIRFAEKRPFFIEGSDILRFGGGGAANLQNFNWRNPDFFYSRRIGRAPQGSVTHRGFRNIPDRTSILGAAKVSGKVDESWSFAALAALTSREYGRVDSAGVRFSEEIEPLTFYGVVRSRKEFNGARQGLGMLATYVERDPRERRLRDILNQRAVSLGMDGWTFLDVDKQWVLTGWGGFSRVEGSQRKVLSLQRSPQHYFQRPDANHVSVDTTATSLQGWSTRIWLDKVHGNWIFNAAVGAIAPGFETNDAGFLDYADYINAHVYFGYQWFAITELFRYRSLTATALYEYNFGGTRIGESYRLNTIATYLNYWSSYLVLGLNAGSYDDKRTRGGPVMYTPQSHFVQAGVFSDSRKQLSGYLTGYWSRSVAGAWIYLTSVGFTWKASRTLTLRAGPDFSRVHSLSQYVRAVGDPLAVETFGTRYVFSTLDQTTLAATLRLDWVMTPTLSFQVYLQPLISAGLYTAIKELTQPRTYDFLEYGTKGSTITREENRYIVDPDGPLGPAPSFRLSDPSFNIKSLRANAVLRWEYSPGSTLYLVWTNSKYNSENHGTFNLGNDVERLLRQRPDNVLAVKMTYYWGR